MKMSIEEYMLSLRTDQVHVLDLIRLKKWSDEEIASQLKALHAAKRVVFCYHGSFIFGHIISLSPEDWEKAQQRGTVLNSFLRSNYKRGILKKEILALRKIMRLIFDNYDEDIRGGRSPYEWGFVRRLYITL